MLTHHLVGIMLAEKRLRGNKPHKESSASLVIPSTMEWDDGFGVIINSWIDWFNLSKGY